VREPSFTEVHAAKNKERKDTLVMEVEQLEDRENTGLIGSIGFGLSDYLTRAALGSLSGGLPGAISVTGLSETNYSYEDLTHKGVDSSTALKVSAIDGVIAGGATALPLSYGFKGAGGVLGDAALSVAGATAITTGGRYASGQVLESEGYEKQAKKYEITAESVGTELILNSLLFGAGRYARSRSSNDVNADFIDGEFREITAENIETRNTQVESALLLNEMQFEDAAAPVRPSNPIQHNNHLKNLNEATENLKAGRPVNVDHSVKGEEKQKPVNYETMALPSNAKSIARKAQQEGVNPSVALTISHIETGGRFNHTAKNPTSSAHGLFQILDKTWKGQGGGDRYSIDEQIKQGLKHIKNANASMRKSLGREPVEHEQYLGHLLGPGGAAAVLKADPNAKLIDVVRKYDSKNANDIVNNNGMSGLTVGQAIGKWEQKWNQLSSRYGGKNRSTAIGMDGTSYDMAYEIKSLDELIASNDAAYGVNPKYPSELQPRDRTREASRQQIENMANDLRPELLGESYKLSDGAPIIGMDNVVESGNGRTLAIGKAYENGRAEEYQKYIEQYAADRGWDISGINKPVLVRTRLTDTDRVQFTKLANESDVAQFSASERAASDVDRLPDSSLLRINSDGNINLEQSMDFVRSFVDSLPKSEQGSVITADGRLSQDGKRRIESALTQRAYGDSSLVTRLSENLDDDSKTFLNALLRVAPQLAQLGDLVKQGGRHSNSIAQDLAQAAQKLSDLKANGVRVDDYLNQGQLIEDGLSPGARDFLNVFDQNKRSTKAIGENIQSKIDEIDAMGDPRQGSLFGDGPEESAALDIIMQNPDQHISVTRYDPDGNPEEITMTLRERLNELEAEAKQAQQDTLAAQTAISCALQFGE
ncbi:MAG TPA: lytic transglycosylase domain-containing protein, partial [Acinetobacter johnsonii]|nr:lytic transglycosylase domain-containing protein [Acinetobacter johnsonii]